MKTETIRRHRFAAYGSAVTVGVLLALFFSYAFALPAYQNDQAARQISTSVQDHFSKDARQVFNPVVTISVYASPTNHTLLHRQVMSGDLATNNLVKFFLAWFTPSGGSTTATLTAVSGASRTITVNSAGGTAGGIDCATTPTTFCDSNGATNMGASIGLGTGACSAARTDTALCTPYQSAVYVGNAGYDPSSGNVTLAVTQTAGTSTTITEAGVIMSWSYASGSIDTFLVFHDTGFSVAVTSGNVIAAQYVLELLNTGFTTAFGNALAGIFSSCGGSQCTSNIPIGTVTSIGGTARGLYQVYGYNGGGMIGAQSGAYPYIQIGIGTTAQARSMTKLVTSTCATNLVQTPTTVSTSTLALGAGVSCSSAQTITEADLVVTFAYAYCPLTCSPYPDSFMLWRTLFTGVAVPQGGAIGIQFNFVFP